jgi:hypothetical protein
MSEYNSVEALLEAIGDQSLDQIASLMKLYSSSFEYQGFNPRYIIGLISERCRRYSLNEKKMVVLAIGTLISRGTKVAKIKNKSLEEYKASLERLSRILTTKTGQSLTKDDITLPRIAACYPELTARFVVKLDKNIIPGFESLNPLLRSHCFAAVCPSDSSYMEHAKANVLWNIEFDRMVRPRDPTPATKTALYWKAAHASIIMSNEDRKKLMTELGISPPSDDFKKAKQSALSNLPVIEFAAPVMSNSIVGSAFSPPSATPSAPSSATPSEAGQTDNRPRTTSNVSGTGGYKSKYAQK